MINLHHFRVFYHVAKNLSYTLAARDLYITQPAVTKQVKALEEMWDLNLFSKKGVKIVLTDEGEVLFEYAKKIFEYEKEVEQAVEEIKSLERGTLRIASPKPIDYMMNFLMEIFHKEYPRIRIQISEGNSLTIMHRLLDNEIEVAFMAKIEEHPDVQFIHFSHEEVSFVVSPDHHLVKKKCVSIKELSEEPIMLKAVGSGTHKLAIGLFNQKNYKPNILLETSNTEYIKEVVQRGEAGAFLAEADISILVSEGKLVKIPVDGKRIFLEIYIAYLKDQSLSQPAETFLKLLGKLDLKKHFPYLVSSWPEDFPYKE